MKRECGCVVVGAEQTDQEVQQLRKQLEDAEGRLAEKTELEDRLRKAEEEVSSPRSSPQCRGGKNGSRRKTSVIVSTLFLLGS